VDTLRRILAAGLYKWSTHERIGVGHPHKSGVPFHTYREVVAENREVKGTRWLSYIPRLLIVDHLPSTTLRRGERLAVVTVHQRPLGLRRLRILPV
jgi:hypothetical protein